MEQEAPNAIIFTSDVKISQTAKGLAQVDVHVYGVDDAETRKRAVELYKATLEDLKTAGLPVATEAKA